MKSRRRWLIATGVVALLVAGLACLCRPRAQEYRWYVSPPLDAAGHRVKVLVPVGWAMDRGAMHLPMAAGGDGRFAVTFSRRSWSPMCRLRARLGRSAADGPYVYIGATRRSPTSSAATGAASGREMVRRNMSGDLEAVRVIKVGDPPMYVWAEVVAGDGPTFRAVHSAICNSLRIEPSGDTKP